MQTFRADRSSLDQAARRTDEGFIVDRPIVTRTGVFPYLNPDGSTRWELRHPNDVYAADSLATLSLLPVTNGHPAKAVDAATVKALSVGMTGDSPSIDGANVLTSVKVTDAGAVGVIESGRRELSLGYKVDLREEDGVYDGKPYTHRQTNIRYNHLALVDRARMGSTARLNIDGAEQIDENEAGQPTPRKDNRTMENMVKVNLDGLVYDAAAEVGKALEKLRADAATLQQNLTAEKARADKLEAERDAANDKVKALEGKDTAQEIADGVRARMAILQVATKALPKETADKLETMSDGEIRAAVIKAASPDVNLDGKSAEYIAARYDAAVEVVTQAKRGDSAAAQRQTAFPRHDGTGGADKADDARERMMAGQSWRGRQDSASNAGKN